MILATNNKGKLREIKAILNEYEIKSLEEVNINIEVDEDQDSFYGNALKKAKEIYEVAKEPTIADDSGLCIDYFNDWPGVYTARFLGENTTAEERNNYIIEKMQDLKGEDRKAHIVCNLVYFDGKNTILGEGILYGKIADSRCGSNGFGFDEIFELDNGKTLAELPMNEKNTLSARYLATLDLKEKLKELN
jgi:XTP/dITP diphosphohydrolase